LTNLGQNVTQINPNARETVRGNFEGAVRAILDASQVSR